MTLRLNMKLRWVVPKNTTRFVPSNLCQNLVMDDDKVTKVGAVTKKEVVVGQAREGYRRVAASVRNNVERGVSRSPRKS